MSSKLPAGHLTYSDYYNGLQTGSFENHASFIDSKFNRRGACNFSDYSFMSEHTDLRHIMGVGIAITRGSAAALSFCYSLLLLTMCRNTLTKLKEWSVQQYIPLDSHVQFHKIVACTAGFFSVLHSIGHIVNFYHVSTQPLVHLQCLSSELRFSSDARPTISFWLFETVTGELRLIVCGYYYTRDRWSVAVAPSFRASDG